MIASFERLHDCTALLSFIIFTVVEKVQRMIQVNHCLQQLSLEYQYLTAEIIKAPSYQWYREIREVAFNFYEYV